MTNIHSDAWFVAIALVGIALLIVVCAALLDSTLNDINLLLSELHNVQQCR